MERYTFPCGEPEMLMEITAKGRRVHVRQNDQIVVDANLEGVALGHATRVEFRNIRTRELP